MNKPFLMSLLSFSMFMHVCASSQTLQKIRSSNTLTIAHRDASVPFSYLDSDKRPRGFALELCLRIAQRVATELKLTNLQVKYLAVTPGNRIEAIETGQADIECGSTTDNHDRRQRVAFSLHHYFASIQMLVKTNSVVKDWPDLDKKKVAIISGSSTLVQIKKQAAIATLAIAVEEVKDHTAGLSLLEAGKVDAYISDDVVLAGLRANSLSPQDLLLVGRRFTIEPYGLILRKDDREFKKLADSVLRDLMKSGQYAQLYAQWFTQPIPPKNINLNLPASMLLRDQIRSPSDLIPSRL